MKFVTINQLNTCYYTGGIGKKHILFIHGWASSGRMWLRSMWALRHGYRSWAPDLPGCGDSQGPELPWSAIMQYTDHLASFCAKLKIKPYAVVGHSMGGRIAFDLARRYPDRVGRVVAVSPTVTGRLGLHLDVFLLGGLGHTMLDFARRLWPVATASTMAYYWAPKHLGSEAVERTTADLRRADWDMAVGGLKALVRQDYSPLLANISQPALVICGGRDYSIPVSDSRLAAQMLPQAQLMVLDGVHHQPMDESPQVFFDALRAFLANGHHG